MSVRTEHYDGTEMSLIAHKIHEIEDALKAKESVGWNLWHDPELPERLGRVVLEQMQRRKYVVYAEGDGTVSISRKP